MNPNTEETDEQLGAEDSRGGPMEIPGRKRSGRSPFPLRMWDWTTARVLYTATLYGLLLYLIRAARDTLTLFLFAILFAYFLLPLVNRLEGPLRGRGRAILAIYLILAGVLGGAGFLVVPKIIEEARQLGASLPSLANRLASGELLQTAGQKFHWSAELIGQIQAFLSDHRDDIEEFGKTIAASFAKPASHIWWLILIPILTMFFLAQGREIAANTASLATDVADRNEVEALFADINVLLGSYIRCQITLAGFTLAAYMLVMGIMQVPYTFILGPLAGFLEFIPVVGPAVAAASILIIAILAGYAHVGWLLVFLAAWRMLQDYVNAPRLMSQSLEIDPLMQIFAVLAGGEIAGVVGALVSVPVAAVLRIIWRRMHSDAPKEVGPDGETYTGPVPH
jgi:predicted PurR-regulated permease PerM